MRAVDRTEGNTVLALEAPVNATAPSGSNPMSNHQLDLEPQVVYRPTCQLYHRDRANRAAGVSDL